MVRWIAAGLLLTACVSSNAIAGPWNPKLRFSVEDARYDETLMFVSGVAYALAYSTGALQARKEANFFCLPADRILDARLLVQLLNARVAGPQAADVFVKTVTAALSEEFLCKDRHAAREPKRGRLATQ